MAVKFIIITRQATDGRTIYYARFSDTETGKTIKTVSTGLSNKRAAERKAQELLENGIVPDSQNPLVVEYLLNFWSKDSAYYQLRAAQGHELSAVHLNRSRSSIDLHFKDYLDGVRIADLTPGMIEKAALSLKKAGLGSRTINFGIVAIKTAVKEWGRQNRLPDPLSSVRKHRDEPKEKGILTIEELRAIIGLVECKPRIRSAVLLGALCGLRAGEILGLLWEDIDFNTKQIHVCHNITDDKTTLKSPKWGSARVVPLLAEVATALLQTQQEAVKFGITNRFVHWSPEKENYPCDYTYIRNGFHDLLDKIGIKEEVRKKRNLTLHSLRHGFVTLARSEGLSDQVVQQLSGHKTSLMMNHYSGHSELVNMDLSRKALDTAIAPKKPKKKSAKTENTDIPHS